ncbi:MAG TPA: UDP-N-acetylglucosamine pyrophosphorylase [Desulfomonilia bacterium]|nr:UDP-N-acetylglucosamine pyrophosphorylase [Desulfomonilia bacterium]
MEVDPRIRALREKGVTIPDETHIYLGPDVDIDMISQDGVTIHPGCRITGEKTLIMEGVSLGREAPVTLEDCQLGPHVELKGGYFRESVFFEGSAMSSGAHVREACILEEESSCAHTVGLKQTVLFPFVTLGSLINFCDCLMAGGTSRKDHSEVGSSYIHFNFTPSQDKATPSLIGDVPHGVMLDQRPIFLGGQGGLVGPSVIGYGTVVAAGVVFRGDFREGHKIITGMQKTPSRKKLAPGLIMNVKEKVVNNITYIANLIALRAWYFHVRSLFTGLMSYDITLLEAAIEKLDMAFDERMKRLEDFIDKVPESLIMHKGPVGSWAPPAMILQQEELFRNWSMIADHMHANRSYSGSDQGREAFLSVLYKDMPDKASGYINSIKGLPETTRKGGTVWLNSIVHEITTNALAKIPSFK